MKKALRACRDIGFMHPNKHIALLIKNVKTAGFGYENLVKIPVDDDFAMQPL